MTLASSNIFYCSRGAFIPTPFSCFSRVGPLLRPDIGANQRISSLLLKIPDGELRSISRPEFVHERPHNDFRRAIGNAEFPANDLIRVALA